MGVLLYDSHKMPDLTPLDTYKAYRILSMGSSEKKWFIKIQLLLKGTLLLTFMMSAHLWTPHCSNVHSQPFHCAKTHASMCAVDILNIFLHKSMQILMFMFSIKIFLSCTRYDVTVFFRILLENYEPWRYSCLWFPMYIKRGKCLCRVWVVLREQSVYK